MGILVLSDMCSLASASQLPNPQVGPANVLLPQPATMTVQTGELTISVAPAVTFEGPHSDRLVQAVARTMHQLQTRAGLLSHPGLPPAEPQNNLTIRIHDEGLPVQGLDEDERYALDVTHAGIRIDAPTVSGAMHGLQTMLQLAQPSSQGFVLPLVSIQDVPRFRWRGLMIDCSRHFEPIPVLKRTLDAMAAVKMNVFHWHLTDDQGFRIESHRFPALTQKGSAGLFYTQEEARDLVRYARDRGIRVVPEFEMPGHSTAWLVAYPELSSGKPPQNIRNEFGIANYAIDPTREATYTFLASFLTEMTDVFPDEYVHIGGDETPAPDWKSSPSIRAFMKQQNLKDSDALQAYFNQRVLKILTGLHKRMIGWDEILNPALPKDVIIQSWRGEKSLVKAAQQGYQGVLSAPYYLDAMHSAGEHYLADPVPADTILTEEQRRLVLGGEVCMWSEQIDERTIDSRVWPRTAAVAERLWSPASVKDVGDLYRRLDAVSLELESLGLTHLSHQDAGLRQLAGTAQIEPLRLFASVLEPVSFSDRYKQQKTSQSTQLDNFVDAVRPDAPSSREFRRLTHDFLAGPRTATEPRDQLRTRFAELSSALTNMQEQKTLHSQLAAVQPRADQLAGLTKAALEAIAYLSSGTNAPVGWRRKTTALIATAKQPSAIVRFTILDSLTQLFAAVPVAK